MNEETMIHVEGIKDEMIANNLTPFKFTHPGEIIKDELEDRGISQREFAQNVGMSYSVLNELLNAHRPLTTNTALLFEAALGLPAELLKHSYQIQPTDGPKRQRCHSLDGKDSEGSGGIIMVIEL